MILDRDSVPARGVNEEGNKELKERGYEVHGSNCDMGYSTNY
jgi:hypothetical protein